MNIAGLLSLFHAIWAVPTLIRLYSSSHSNISQFEVHSLPDSPSLGPSWAGRLHVPETEEENSMFFWLFPAEDPTYDDNLIIWFNGGPGCSSLIGLTTGNGPVSFDGNSTHLIRNQYSWSKLGHVLYVDQPVGTGLSTASTPYPVLDNDRVASDFYKWLRSFFSYFHYLRDKQVHLVGESYAGIYIPYFAAAIMDNQDLFPVNLRSMAIGDGTWGNGAAMSSASTGAFLQSQQSLLNIPDDILSTFAEADDVCGFDSVMNQASVFPPKGKIDIPEGAESLTYKARRRSNESPIQHRVAGAFLDETCNTHPTTSGGILSSILNSTCQGPCATFSTALDYLTSRTPSGSSPECFDIYDVTNDCNTIDPLPLLASYFSRGDVQAALNALPSSSNISNDNSNANASANAKSFAPCNPDILRTLLSAIPPTPPAYSILPKLVTSHNVSLHIFSGDHDMLINHFGTELCLQNMTWNGAQGFSEKPNRVFFADSAAPAAGGVANMSMRENIRGDEDDSVAAGIWADERGVTYHLFWDAGHSVFVKKPREMFAFVRDVVVGRSS